MKKRDDEIVAVARKLVERHGHDGFSMYDIATAVGVQAPALYARFADRAALLAAVEIVVLESFKRALRRAPRSPEPVETLAAQAHAYRTFAKRNPEGYALINTPNNRNEEAERTRASAFATTMLPPFIALVGESHALLAARVLIPFLHGFVSMELAQSFYPGGSVDDAFENGLALILEGLSRSFVQAPERPQNQETARSSIAKSRHQPDS